MPIMKYIQDIQYISQLVLGTILFLACCSNEHNRLGYRPSQPAGVTNWLRWVAQHSRLVCPANCVVISITVGWYQPAASTPTLLRVRLLSFPPCRLSLGVSPAATHVRGFVVLKGQPSRHKPNTWCATWVLTIFQSTGQLIY